MDGFGETASQLNPAQRELLMTLSNSISAVAGVEAVVLGGSFARGKATDGSDLDIGLLYHENAPFDIRELSEIAGRIADDANIAVTGFYDWGPWANGGAWLSVNGQRVDLIYRSIDQIERVISDSMLGKYELHYLQQPPFGFLSVVYLGEVSICRALSDPQSITRGLKERVAEYPDALRFALIRDFLFMAEFNVGMFAPKFASRGDAFGTASCLMRAVNELTTALFAINRQYPVNDKTAVAEADRFESKPANFAERVARVSACIGKDDAELGRSVEEIAALVAETIDLAGSDYRSKFAIPK